MTRIVGRASTNQRSGRPVSSRLLAVLAAVLAATAPAEGSEPARRALVERPPVTWRHALAWTLSSDEVLFGRVAAVKLLCDGVAAIADMQLGQVLLIAPDGSLQAVLPVAGEGPGQVGRLAGLGPWPPDRLFLVQAWPGRVEVIDRDGTPVRSLVLGGRGQQDGLSTLLSLDRAHGCLVGVQVHIRFLDWQRSMNSIRLSLFDDELSPVAHVLERRRATVDRMGIVDETEMDFPVHAWSIVDGRSVIVAPDRTAYRLELHDAGLGLREVFSRDLAPLPRPEAEKDRLRSEFSLEIDGRRRAIEFVFFQTAQMIQAIEPVTPRRLLLTTAYLFHGLSDPVTARLDDVDLEQGTVREVHLTIPVDPVRDRLLALPNRDVVVLAGGTAAIDYWRFEGE